MALSTQRDAGMGEVLVNPSRAQKPRALGSASARMLAICSGDNGGVGAGPHAETTRATSRIVFFMAKNVGAVFTRLQPVTNASLIFARQPLQLPQHPPQFLHLPRPQAMRHLARPHSRQTLGRARPGAGAPVHPAAHAPTHRSLPAWLSGPRLGSTARRRIGITTRIAVLQSAATHGVVSHLLGHLPPPSTDPALPPRRRWPAPRPAP